MTICYIVKYIYNDQKLEHMQPNVLQGIIVSKVVYLITEHLSSSNLDSWQIKVRATSEGAAEQTEHWTHFFKIYINFIDIISRG